MVWSNRRIRVIAAAAALLVTSAAFGPARAEEPDPLHRAVDAELTSFLDWLARNRAAGYVGEVGWPVGKDANESRRWSALAERWYTKADAAGLWVTSWLTTEGWGTSHPLSVYASRAPARPIELTRPQAGVVERHRSGRRYLRGVNFSGGETGFPHAENRGALSNAAAGTHGVHYGYGTAATYTFLAARGVKLVRLPMRWERIQRTLRGPLAAAELGYVRDAVNRIRKAGMTAVLDLHNFGGYYAFDPTTGAGRRLALGTKELPVSAFADVWKRLALAFRGHAGVVAFDLMNEPTTLGGNGARVWEHASQAAVDAIRSTGDRRTIVVEGYNWSALHSWTRTHPTAWIRDPADNVRYSPHHYWDSRHSSHYATYDEELKAVPRR